MYTLHSYYCCSLASSIIAFISSFVLYRLAAVQHLYSDGFFLSLWDDSNPEILCASCWTCLLRRSVGAPPRVFMSSPWRRNRRHYDDGMAGLQVTAN